MLPAHTLPVHADGFLVGVCTTHHLTAPLASAHKVDQQSWELTDSPRSSPQTVTNRLEDGCCSFLSLRWDNSGACSVLCLMSPQGCAAVSHRSDFTNTDSVGCSPFKFLFTLIGASWDHLQKRNKTKPKLLPFRSSTRGLLGGNST